jgi:hypothetical protein
MAHPLLRLRRVWALSIATVWLLAGDAAHADGSDVTTVFFIAKSENKNQVHYGIHLDADCVPSGSAPVFAYWRMLERGPSATEPLLSREIPAYGFASQQVSSQGASGGSVTVTLRALPERPIVVTSWRQDGACAASAETNIAGVPALLTRVYVQLRWPFGVDSLTLDGYAKSDHHAVRERIAK